MTETKENEDNKVPEGFVETQQTAVIGHLLIEDVTDPENPKTIISKRA